MRIGAAGLRVLAVLVVLTIATVAVIAWRATVATSTYRASSVVETVGRALTATATIAATHDVTADYAGICFTGGDGYAVDFPLQREVGLTRTAATVSSSAELAPGTYTFTACVRIEGSWSRVGQSGEVVVVDDQTPRTASTPMSAKQGSLASTPTPTTTASSSTVATSADAGGTVAAPSATAATSATAGSTAADGSVLPVGDLPGWHQVLAEDFKTPVDEGSFPGRAYRSHWFTYDGFENPAGTLLYDTKNVTSVHDGLLDVRVRSEDGRARGAGIVALVNGDGTWGGRTYGRYSVRFRAEPAAGWGTAMLLWSDRNVWNDGEIDFAEGLSTGTVDAYNHRLDEPAENDLSVHGDALWSDWHVATAEWTPDGVTFLLDGRVTGHSDVSPSAPLHLVMQTVTGTTAPPADSTGHLYVDWVTAYERS